MEKAGLIAMVKVRQLPIDEKYSLRGNTLEQYVKEDRQRGLIPFFVCDLFIYLFIEYSHRDNLESIRSVAR